MNRITAQFREWWKRQAIKLGAQYAEEQRDIAQKAYRAGYQQALEDYAERANENKT